jgi:hypothetical protein
MANNFAEAMQQGYAFGANQRKDREAEQRRTGLASLAQQAYAAQPAQRQALVGQAIGLDPEAGFGLDKSLQGNEDRKQKQLVQLAKGWKQITDPAQRKQFYDQFVHPAVSQMGLGDLGQYDENAVNGVAEQILAAYGDAGPAGNVQSTYIDAQGNRVAIMRDGTTAILGQNAPNNQIIDTGNGFYGVNKGNLQAAPVNVGTPAAQGASPNQEALLAQANQMVQSGVPDTQVDQWLQSQLSQPAVAQPQAQQLRSAPKPQAPSDIERRLALADSMGATPEQKRAMVLGNASTKGPTAAEQKDALARKAKQPQVANVARGLERIATSLQSLSGGMVNTGPIDQYATRYTKAGQELEAAVGGIQNSLLSLTRVPGIGSQSDLEARIAAMQYPSLDKDPEVNARTLQNLQAFVADLQEAYRLADASVSAEEETDDLDSLLELYR